MSAPPRMGARMHLVLVLLDESGGMTRRELYEAMAVSKANLAAAVRLLRKKSMIVVGERTKRVKAKGFHPALLHVAPGYEIPDGPNVGRKTLDRPPERAKPEIQARVAWTPESALQARSPLEQAWGSA